MKGERDNKDEKKKGEKSRKKKRICIFVLEIESCFEARQKRDLYLKQ